MRNHFLALTLFVASAVPASALTCKQGQGEEIKVEFALDGKGNPLMPEKHESATYLRIVHQVCIDGPTSVTFSAAPNAKFRSVHDAHEAARLLVELHKLGLAPEATQGVMKHVVEEHGKVTPKQPKVADGAAPAGALKK